MNAEEVDNESEQARARALARVRSAVVQAHERFHSGDIAVTNCLAGCAHILAELAVLKVMMGGELEIITCGEEER